MRLSDQVNKIVGGIYLLIIAAAIFMAVSGLAQTDISPTSLQTIARLVFLTNIASTVFLTGLIWTIQRVNYPLFSKIDPSSFHGYHQDHVGRITIVVAVPMLLELVSSLLLLVYKPDVMSLFKVWFGIGLTAVIWISTVFLQVPQHNLLKSGYKDLAQKRLTATNWIRTAAWSTRSGLLLSVLYQQLAFQA